MGGSRKGGCSHSKGSTCSCHTLLDSGLPRRGAGWCREMPAPRPTAGPGEAWPGLGQSLPGKGKAMLWGQGRQQLQPLVTGEHRGPALGWAERSSLRCLPSTGAATLLS